MSSPNDPSTNPAKARTSGSSGANRSARRARSIALRRFISGSSAGVVRHQAAGDNWPPKRGAGAANARIAFDRPPPGAGRAPGGCGPSRRRNPVREGAQVEVVGGQIMGRSGGRAADLGGLQRRFDDADNAYRHLVLKLEHVFERAVEPVGPKMRAGEGIDQLRGDAHPVPALAHRKPSSTYRTPRSRPTLLSHRPPDPCR